MDVLRARLLRYEYRRNQKAKFQTGKQFKHSTTGVNVLEVGN